MRHAVYAVAGVGHALHVGLDGGKRPSVNHRPHVGVQLGRRAHANFGHGPLQHVQQAVGHVFLHAQHAQGRAALAGRFKGRRHGIGGHLLQQGR